MIRIAYFGQHKSGSTYIKSVVQAAAGAAVRSEFLSTRLPLGRWCRH